MPLKTFSFLCLKWYCLHNICYSWHGKIVTIFNVESRLCNIHDFSASRQVDRRKQNKILLALLVLTWLTNISNILLTVVCHYYSSLKVFFSGKFHVDFSYVLRLLSNSVLCLFSFLASTWIPFQALSQMNRLHEALAHLLTALQILGKKQPTSALGCYIRIRKEALRHYLHVFLPGYYIGGARYGQFLFFLMTSRGQY